jgi:uncharacterized protein (TIGR02270 family)
MPLPTSNRPIVATVLAQHIEDIAVVYSTRATLAKSPHVRLHNLGRFDDRLEAHLDGLLVAGESGWPFCTEALERGSLGSVFAAAVTSIANWNAERLDRLFALVAAQPQLRTGLFSAFAWLEGAQLRGVIVELLRSTFPLKRLAGVAVCSMHRVDPGLTSARRLEDTDSSVRARAWRSAGELGMHDLRSIAVAATADEDSACRFWAAWSGVLLGGKGRAIEVLKQVSAEPGPLRARAFQLGIQAMSIAESHALLRSWAQDPAQVRSLIRGAGLVGDPAYMPWLIDFMADDARARLAGESLSLITGLDLAWLDLERKPPENFESGPNDDPNDANVEMDEDDGLPWPDQAKIQAWWNENSQRFQPGVRYFMGQPLNPENCLRVLKEGFQRQRILAAHYLCLLKPGTVLFNTSAPAWRQQRLLAQMS